METLSTTHRPDTTVHDGVVAVALMSLGFHMAEHHLPAPQSIDVEHDATGAPSLRVRVPGAGDQMRWLNTVAIDGQDEEPTEVGARIVWHVRIPFGTRVELIGLRNAAGVPA